MIKDRIPMKRNSPYSPRHRLVRHQRRGRCTASPKRVIIFLLEALGPLFGRSDDTTEGHRHVRLALGRMQVLFIGFPLYTVVDFPERGPSCGR